METNVSLERFRLVVLLIALLALAIWRFGPQRPTRPGTTEPNAPAVQIAEAALANFHDGLGAGRYQSTCEIADSQAFSGITGLTCAEFLDFVRGRLGAFRHSTQLQSPVTQNAPAGSAIRVALQHTTTFERDTASEHSEWRIDAGKATLTSYSISASVLER